MHSGALDPQADRKWTKRAFVALGLVLLAVLLGPLVWKSWKNAPERLGTWAFVYDPGSRLEGKTKRDLEAKLARIEDETDCSFTLVVFRDELSEQDDRWAMFPALEAGETRTFLFEQSGKILISRADDSCVKTNLDPDSTATSSLRVGNPDSAAYSQLDALVKAAGLDPRFGIYQTL